jgi:hypothetical protein
MTDAAQKAERAALVLKSDTQEKEIDYLTRENVAQKARVAELETREQRVLHRLEEHVVELQALRERLSRLSAIRAETIEECAKVAGPSDKSRLEEFGDRVEIAQAIRSLATPQETET